MLRYNMLKAALIGTIAAMIAVAITFFIGDAASGPLMATPPGGDAPEEIPVGAALFGVAFGGIVGLVIAALSKRLLGGNAMTGFIGICVLGLILYGIFAFSAADTAADGIWLNIMHIVAAIPIVGLLSQAIQAPKGSQS